MTAISRLRTHRQNLLDACGWTLPDENTRELQAEIIDVSRRLGELEAAQRAPGPLYARSKGQVAA